MGHRMMDQESHKMEVEGSEMFGGLLDIGDIGAEVTVHESNRIFMTEDAAPRPVEDWRRLDTLQDGPDYFPMVAEEEDKSPPPETTVSEQIEEIINNSYSTEEPTSSSASLLSCLLPQTGQSSMQSATGCGSKGEYCFSDSKIFHLAGDFAEKFLNQRRSQLSPMEEEAEGSEMEEEALMFTEIGDAALSPVEHSYSSKGSQGLDIGAEPTVHESNRIFMTEDAAARPVEGWKRLETLQNYFPMVAEEEDKSPPPPPETTSSQQIGIINNSYSVEEPTSSSASLLSRSLPQTGQSSMPSASQPVMVSVSEAPEEMRFRFDSEKNKKPSQRRPTCEKNPIDIQIKKYGGNFLIVVDLVVDPVSQQEHVNELYFVGLKKDSKWKKEGKCLVLEGRQKSSSETTLSGYGVERKTKEKKTDVRGMRTEDKKVSMPTDRVVFRFRIYLKDIDKEYLHFSQMVFDSKSPNGPPRIKDVIPNCCGAFSQPTIVVFCPNVPKKHRVVFFSNPPEFRRYATLKQKSEKGALICVAPKFCTPSGGWVKMQIECLETSKRSNLVDFLYEPECDTKHLMKRSITPASSEGEESKTVNEKLAEFVKRRRMESSHEEFDNNIQNDESTCGDGEDLSLESAN